jgi:hypothetical protein
LFDQTGIAVLSKERHVIVLHVITSRKKWRGSLKAF